MELRTNAAEELIDLVRQKFPGWESVADPAFVTDEIAYKRDAAVKVQELLEKQALERLLGNEQYEEVIDRFDQAGKATNLLNTRYNDSHDLLWMRADGLDAAALAPALFDLVHGAGDQVARLGRFLANATAHAWPQKWSFSTYFPFLLNPATEIFIKPTLARWFIKTFAGESGLPRLREATSYAEVRSVFHQLKEELAPYGAQDMIDVQSVVYVAYVTQNQTAQPLASPFNTIFADREQAEWAFDFFRDTVEHLGGGLDDPRFAVTLRKDRDMLRLNMGNWMVCDVADQGTVLHLTTLVDPEMSKRFGEPWSGPFKGTDEPYAVYEIPFEAAQEWSEELATIYTRSMAGISDLFQSWQRTNVRSFHIDEIFQALFNNEIREKILSKGLAHVPISPEYPVLPELPDPEGEGKPPSAIAREFKGFTADAFAFLTELEQNNNLSWMNANRERYEGSVREPMRHLFTDLGPPVKRLFDLYLAPDELEIRPDRNHTLASISKNWTATHDNQYYPYFWGAFYRKKRKKQTDAQLFVNIFPDHSRCGFFVGEQADDIRQKFRGRILSDTSAFLELIARLGLTDDFEFIRVDGTRHRMTAVKTADDLRTWLANGDFDVLQYRTAEQAVQRGPALADEILEAFRRVFPVYLWAVADDYETAVTRYLEDHFPGDDIDTDPPPTPYTTADFFANTHLLPDTLEDLLAMIDDRRQVIFSGPPGTGKTWVARELGKLLTGLAEPPSERLEIIQFHPAYSYEDFIEGIRPKSEPAGDGTHFVDYPTLPGVFRRFCGEAARHPNQKHIFIIDEINRGNIPRIFGELMYLLEYRDESVSLPYSGDRFQIPPNVILIGTMNTADRSIALVDMALRRRFHFFRFKADPDLFGRWLDHNGSAVPYLERLYRTVVEAIDDDHYAIGPSYFMKDGLDESLLRRIWKYSILPQIAEYYFDQSGKAEEWDWDGSRVTAIRETGEWPPNQL